ncbi:MAG: DUF4127 family protein, partial [Spirochaetes bacterium]|nr:DUF4127 family protein [Spirochaetota bacterium]
ALPEDDTAEYGYGPEEKAALFAEFRDLGVSDCVLSYPGADEVGSTLVSAAILGAAQASPRVHPVYMDPQAADIVPLYESQPIGTSVVAQIRAAGGTAVTDPAEAEILLAVNTCGDMMREAWSQNPHDECGRRQRGFVNHVARLARRYGVPIAVADCASSNGGATALIRAVEDRELWPKVISYAGWNTSGNTAGTAIAAALLLCRFDHTETQIRNLSYRLLDDWAYQAVVRQKLARSPQLSAASGSRKWSDEAREMALNELNRLWRETFRRGLLPADPGLTDVRFPWDRLFEIELFFGPPVPPTPFR